MIPNFASVDCELIIASRVNTTVTVENPVKGYNQTYNLTANVATTVNIPLAVFIATTPETIDYFALYVHSPDFITVYAVNATSGSADGSLILPKSALGTEYFATSYPSGLSPTIITLVGVENDTEIDITLSASSSAGRLQGVPFHITLDRFQTYTIHSNSPGDFTGSKIKVTNNKNVAVFCGTKCVNIPFGCFACDMLYEQLTPVHTWGKNFLISPPTKDSIKPDYTYRVIASQDSTQIYANGILVNTVNAGGFIEVANQSGTVCVSASKPVMVVQYYEGMSCVNLGDPSMVIIPPMEQTVKRVNFSTASFAGFDAHFASITLKTSAINNVKVDGAAVNPARFIPFGNCPAYSYASVAVSGGTHLVECDSGFIFVAYGYGHAVSYSFIGGSDFKNLNLDIAVSGVECGALDFDFETATDNSTPLISSKWDFGDGTTDTGKQVAKTYANHGTYTITNIVSVGGDNPFTDTLTKILTTLVPPRAAFGTNQPSQCKKDNLFLFNDTSAYGAGTGKFSSVWSFSDTAWEEHDSMTVKRSYTHEGTTKVKLKVMADNSCEDSVEKTISIMPSAFADFIADSVQCFKGNSYQPVQNSAISAPESLTGFNWDFGDGTTSAVTMPVKSFTDTGIYPVQLIAYASNGCNDTLVKKFTVLPSPAAGFNAPDVCDGDSVIIKNTTTIKKGSLNYSWDYGNGSADTVFDKNIFYPDTGAYLVKLKAVAENGCADSMLKTVRVMPKPVANFTTKGHCALNPVTFTDGGTHYNVPVQQNHWYFGDSTDAQTTGNAVHTYTTNGEYDIMLVTQDANGCSDSITKKLHLNILPSVAFRVDTPTQCLDGNNFNFFNESFVTEGHIDSYQWFLDNTALGSQINADYSAPAAGTHEAKLKVTTGMQCSDSAIKTITIYPHTEIDIAVNDSDQCLNNNSFIFTNNSFLPTGFFTSEWIFSSHNTYSSDNILPQSFNVPGKYSLLFVTTTDRGCKDSIWKVLVVSQSPEVDFETQPVCTNDSALFTNTSVGAGGGAAKWLWQFGDGHTSTAKEPFHFYSLAGYYKVTLTGISANGCSDTLARDSAINIVPAPIAYFTMDEPDIFSSPITVKFHNHSQYGTNYFWSFGNGKSNREVHPIEKYYDTGRYTVSLAVSNDFSCFDDFDTTLYLAPVSDIYIPNAFTPNSDPLNAVFKIAGVLYYREFKMLVFDRWGKLMFYSDDPERGWDGRYEGVDVAEGVYQYIIEFKPFDGKIKTYTGNVHLLR